MVSLLNVWTPVFPQWITDNIRDQLIIPRLQVRYRLILVDFSRAAAHHGREHLVFYASKKFWLEKIVRTYRDRDFLYWKNLSLVYPVRNHVTLLLSHQSLSACKDGGYRE